MHKPNAQIIATLKALPASRRLAAAKLAETEYFDYFSAIVEFDPECDEEAAMAEAWGFAVECVSRKFN